MSERDGFQPGVPSWIDNLGPDAGVLRDFYGAIFGWEFTGPGPMPGDPPGEYWVARLRGHDVAGVGSLPGGSDASPGWSTYVEVESADRAAEAATEAGGSVLVAPFDALPAGRGAVLADPDGAVFCLWEPRDRRGAQLVNEPGAWSMSALSAADPERSGAFYGAVFGWELDSFELGEGISFDLFRLPGFVGGEPEQPVPRDVVATLAPSSDEPASWNADFWVDDVDATARVAGENGGRTLVDPYEMSILCQAVLSDPNGSPFSVTQLMIGG